MLLALALASIFAVGGYLVGREHSKGGSTPTTPVTSTSAAVVGDPAAGADVFASAGCGGCHVLSAAGSKGTVGPSLDAAKPPEALVIQRVTNGMGAMPAFGDQLSAQQIADVAAYVHESASK